MRNLNYKSGFSVPLVVALGAGVLVVGALWYFERQSADLTEVLNIAQELGAKQVTKPVKIKTASSSASFLVASSTASSTTETSGMGPDGYSEYDPEKLPTPAGTRVVFFFFAGWDQLSRDLDMSFVTYRDKLPVDIVLLKTNFEERPALKTKYGVTTPNTFVLADRSGKLIKKWSDSKALADVLVELQ